MDPKVLAQAAGTTVVALMATDAWQRTRDGVVALWRRVRPAQADEVGTALEETREEILVIRREGDSVFIIARRMVMPSKVVWLAAPTIAVSVQSGGNACGKQRSKL